MGGELPAIGQLTSALENNEASRVAERTVTSNLAPTYNRHVHRARVCVCVCVCGWHSVGTRVQPFRSAN